MSSLEARRSWIGGRPSVGTPSGSRPTSTGTGSAGLAVWHGGLPFRCSTLVVGLLLWLAGRGGPSIVEAARTGIGPSIGWGLLAFFGCPSWASLPWSQSSESRSAWLCSLHWADLRNRVRRCGLDCRPGILRVLALVPILGGLVAFAGSVLGLGALIVAIWRAGNASQATPATA